MRFVPRQLLVLPCVALVALSAACGGPATSGAGASHHGSSNSTSSTASTSPPTTSMPSTSGLSTLQSVKWTSVTVPGDVCPGRTAPITLSHGKATIPTPPGVKASGVQVSAGPHVFGDLYGPGHDVAALNVWCDGAHGSAASQLQDSWVIYTDAGGTLKPLTTLTPQQPAQSRKGVHVPYFDDGPGGITITPDRVTVKELWYTSSDHTCCPSEHVTTIWHAHGTSFSAYTEF